MASDGLDILTYEIQKKHSCHIYYTDIFKKSFVDTQISSQCIKFLPSYVKENL